MEEVDIDELLAKHLCHDCVREAYLSAEILANGSFHECSYCTGKAAAWDLEEVSERIANAFEQHYYRTSDQPNSRQQTLLSDRESNYDWERDGEMVVCAIENAAGIPEEAAEDIQKILEDKFGDFEADKMGEETEFATDSYYKEKRADDIVWREEWRAFEKSLKQESRFFSGSAANHLKSVFEGIDAMRTRDDQPLVVSGGPDTPYAALYRARVFQSEDALLEGLKFPDRQLGSPPPKLASAGRMNAKGISVFYGANDPVVALAEVRPPVGSQVATARFDLLRPVKLLDLNALENVHIEGSIFDNSHIIRLERAMFLRSLCRRITKAVMPDDEAFNYIPTQAIADFLASQPDPELDGIIFPSVQAGNADALNVILFHKAARVEDIEMPSGTEVSASPGRDSDEGWETDYSVVEETPPAAQEDEAPVPDGFPHKSLFEFGAADPEADLRKATLKIALNSVVVHHVKAVEFRTEDHGVKRSRWEKREWPF